MIAVYFKAFHADDFNTAIRQTQEVNIAKAKGEETTNLKHIEVCDKNAYNFVLLLIQMCSIYLVNIYKKQSVFKSLLVTYYMFYIFWSGVISYPELRCNDYAESMWPKVLLIILHNLAYVFAFVSLHAKISINESV